MTPIRTAPAARTQPLVSRAASAPQAAAPAPEAKTRPTGALDADQTQRTAARSGLSLAGAQLIVIQTSQQAPAASAPEPKAPDFFDLLALCGPFGAIAAAVGKAILALLNPPEPQPKPEPQAESQLIIIGGNQTKATDPKI